MPFLPPDQQRQSTEGIITILVSLYLAVASGYEFMLLARSSQMACTIAFSVAKLGYVNLCVLNWRTAKK